MKKGLFLVLVIIFLSMDIIAIADDVSRNIEGDWEGIMESRQPNGSIAFRGNISLMMTRNGESIIGTFNIPDANQT